MPARNARTACRPNPSAQVTDPQVNNAGALGTAQRLAERADELAKDITVEIAWNAEFLREGFAIEDTLHPDRLVLGQTKGGKAEEE